MKISICKACAMQRLLIISTLLLTSSFAVQVVSFDDSWGQNPEFNIVSETRSGMELVFSLHEMLIEDVDIDGVPMECYGFASIYIPQAGAPSLGGATRYIAIPQGARAQLTIVDSRRDVYPNVEIAPAPNIPREDDDSPLRYEKDMAVYGRNAYFPASPVMISEPIRIRGVDVVIVNVTPFQYNPVTKELVVYKDLRFRVDYVGGNGHFGEDRLRSRFWEPILQDQLLNYGSLSPVDFYAPERLGKRNGWEYVIIVPDDPDFIAWADTIKTWRKLQGISCEVFTITEVGGNTVTAIENFLNNAYNTWDPAPVAFLLLSDYQSTGRGYGITSPEWSGTGSTCVSDNIYADVDNDELPDMHYARICAQNDEQLGIMIRKFLSYEREPYTAANFYDEPLVACGWQTERWFQLAVEVVRGFFINKQGKNPVRQYNIYSGSPTPGCSWSTNQNTYMIIAYFGTAGLGYIPDTNPYDAAWWSNGSAAGINNAINSGAFLLQHRDHGGVTGWGEPDYDISDLDGLSNDQFVFVNSTNCLTGKYNSSEECFTERFHRMPYGALGLNSASEISYSFVNDAYLWGMYDCLWPDFMPAYPLMGPQIPTGHPNLMPCMAMTSAKYFLHQSGWPYNPAYKAVTINLYHHHGDAFSVLYSEMPLNLTVSHAPVLPAGLTIFTISANDSSVIALTVDGEIIGVAEGTGTPQHITIPAQPPGTVIHVTVTKANYYRYESDVLVTSDAPYVMFISGIIDDQIGGNNDSIANPGETIDYGVWAKNVGNVTAQNVYGVLSTTDSYVLMNTDSSWYGNISENDSALSNPYYEYAIADNCPNGHVINFDLEFQDINDSIFTSRPSITVYAPVLTYQDHAISGGNGNAALQPGETVTLAVTLQNEGGASANNVTSTLHATSSHITINDNSGDFGTIAAGDTATNSEDPYSVTADFGTPCGISVEFSVVVQAGAYVDTLDFSLVIGDLVPSDTGYYYVYCSEGPYSHSPIFDWVAIDSTQGAYPGVSLNLGSNQTIQVNLPFNFQYYGLNYDQISICSNGWIAMGYTSSVDNTNSGIPDSDGPPNMIAGLWDHLEPGNAGQPSDVYYYYDADNNRFIVEYFRIDHHPSGSPETFEIILLDPVYYSTPTGDGEIVVQYLLQMQQDGNTLGIENSSQTVGIQYYYDGTYGDVAIPVTDSFALRYTTYPPEYLGPLFLVSPGSIDFGNVPADSNKTDSVTVTNTGSAILDITSVVSDNSEFTVTPSSGSLAPNDSMEFYITFAPVDSGAETGNIIFTHNALTSPNRVPVTGKGFVGIEETAGDVMPTCYALSQNYPNPFKAKTEIHYQLPQPGVVIIAIYDVSGRRVNTLVDETEESGYYTVTWNGQSQDGKQVSNGVYFCRMIAGEYTSVKKILLMH